MSTITVTNIKATGETASRAVSGVAAAWVNFDGTGTIAARDSFNVASLTDQGTGNYDVSLSNAMASANYCYSGLANGSGSSNSQVNGDGALQASTMLLRTINTADNNQDTDGVYIAAHGDLA